KTQNRIDTKLYDHENDQKDGIIQDLVDDKIKIAVVSSSTFFNLLRKMTIEGAYADPLYGGNRDMKGWKMKDHPGLRASYTDLVDSEEFQKLEPMSLKDYQQ